MANSGNGPVVTAAPSAAPARASAGDHDTATRIGRAAAAGTAIFDPTPEHSGRTSYYEARARRSRRNSRERAARLPEAASGVIAPLLTLNVLDTMKRAARSGANAVACSFDLGRSQATVEVDLSGWKWQGQRFPYPATCKDRTIYYWDAGAFHAAARFTTALVKLVPTEWGPPTFEIDGIKMLPTARISPYADAERKVATVRPRGKVILDTCGGLGYFAAWCLQGQAARILSYEKSADVLWLRSLNPWSPAAGGPLSLVHGDIAEYIASLPDRSVEAVLHDPPRFGIAGELYSAAFYTQLARVLARGGRLFHYTGTPNKVSRGRNLSLEVATRLGRAGFSTESDPDGVLAVRC